MSETNYNLVGLIGKGFVGEALYRSFEKRGEPVTVYDKYKNIGKIEDLKNCWIIFLCLPTPYIEGHGYDLGPIIESCNLLKKMRYKGFAVIKSTVEPGTINKLQEKYDFLLMHNPEFLTARTAFEDFDSQKYIIIGESTKYKVGLNSDIYKLYSRLYPEAKIEICASEESEAVKIFVNSFYSVKVQFFTELYLLCQKIGADFNVIKDMMINLGWINKMHTTIPGPDGQVSYGGACFPKDTSALNHLMKTLGSPQNVLEAAIIERNKMRKD